MRALAERAWFAACLALGWLLRSARYTATRVVDEGGERAVRKRRAAHAPLLIGMGNPLLRMLGAGVRVLPRREWVEREREMYRTLHDAAIHVDAEGTMVLPCLPGATLAALLDDRSLAEPARRRATALAVEALAALHRRGMTHGDAMAENVLVDLAAGVARWIDFETMHDASRPAAWRRADDLRALLATVLLRSPEARRADAVRHVVDAYGDGEVTGLVLAAFASPLRRALPFELGQAALSVDAWRQVARTLRARGGG